VKQARKQITNFNNSIRVSQINYCNTQTATTTI